MYSKSRSEEKNYTQINNQHCCGNILNKGVHTNIYDAKGVSAQLFFFISENILMFWLTSIEV